MSGVSFRIVAAFIAVWPWFAATALAGARAAPSTHARAPAANGRIIHAAREAERLLEAAAAIPGSFPAAVLVVATPNEIPLMYAQGRTRAGPGKKVDAESAIYIGSQTKSFVGLMAARLDREKVFPLDTTLKDVWPKLQLPGNVRPEEITMRDLLSHQEPLKTDTLNFLTAYVRTVPAREYPGMLRRYTKERAPGFSYSNLGYLIYAATLETRTGKSWKKWLQSEILSPLGLTETHTRSTAYDPRDIVWNHQWDGAKWVVHAPKSDGLMHAAGGLFSTPRDMARWMQLNLNRGAGVPGDWKSTFAIAQTPVTAAKMSDGELVCDGYTLGWYACGYKGERILLATGQYTGTRSVTILIPARGAGLSLMASSDSRIEGLALEVIKGFIGIVAGKDGEEARLAKAAADYHLAVASMTASRRAALRDSYFNTIWGGWTWRPSQAEAARFTGTFYSGRLGRLDVLSDAEGLWGHLGAYRFRLQPAQPDLFAAWTTSVEPPAPLKYNKAADTIAWKDSIFRRTAAAMVEQ